MAPSAVTYLDTHVVVWLYAGLQKRFRGEARRRLEHDELRLSPMVLLEIDFLREIGRVTTSGAEMLEALAMRSRLALCTLPFGSVVRCAADLGWTRDPFDRLIVAQAKVADAALVTHDRSIRDHFPGAIWD